MARRWVVVTADRFPFSENEIVAYTEWDGYVAKSDELIFTNPVNADGTPADKNWTVSGKVTLLDGVYTYTPNVVAPTLIHQQRSQIHDAYKYFQRHGRTGHWAALRRGLMQQVGGAGAVVDTQYMPLDATDKWAFHIVAKIDKAILGEYPVSGALSADDLQALIDHDDNILRTLGPTWYGAQLMDDKPTANSGSYANMSVMDNEAIYCDTSTVLGVPRTIDGMWISMAATIRPGFDPESRTLGN